MPYLAVSRFWVGASPGLIRVLTVFPGKERSIYYHLGARQSYPVVGVGSGVFEHSRQIGKILYQPKEVLLTSTLDIEIRDI